MKIFITENTSFQGYFNEVCFDITEGNQLSYFQNGYFFKILWWFHEPKINQFFQFFINEKLISLLWHSFRIRVYLHCVRSFSWCATTLATLACMPAGWKFFQIQMHDACHLVFESLAILYSTYHLTPPRIVFAFPNEADRNSDRNFSFL